MLDNVLNETQKPTIDKLNVMPHYIVLKIEKKAQNKATEAGIHLTDGAALELAESDATTNDPFIEVAKAGKQASLEGIREGMKVLIPADHLNQAMVLPLEDEKYLYTLHNMHSVVAYI